MLRVYSGGFQILLRLMTLDPSRCSSHIWLRPAPETLLHHRDPREAIAISRDGLKFPISVLNSQHSLDEIRFQPI